MRQIESLSPTLDNYTAASEMDPLRLDAFFAELPAINQAGDIDLLYTALAESVVNLIDNPPHSSASALAALRDLDFIASSYLRHGRNPIEDVVGLEDALIALGQLAGTVPRGTVATYALANPADERLRSFTGDPEEVLFIDAVRQTSLALESSLQDFVSLDASEAFATLDTNLDTAIQSIVAVMRTLPPEYFTNEMRPYFDPLVIGGERYLGAGGAQLQFVAFDYVLWGADETDATYVKYFHENYNYLTPSQRTSIEQILEKYQNNTLLKHLALTDDKEAAVSALGALKKMKKFRHPHRKLAQDNFKVRKQGQVGSGSYTTDILDVLLEKTEQAIEVVEEVIAQ
jgi:hypothetical protein